MKAQQLKNAILQLAIQGKLVPQDPSDEPASVLLDKIKQEKDRLIAEGKIKKSKKSADNLPSVSQQDFPFEIPKSWVWVRLDFLGEIIGGGTPKTNEDDNWNKGSIPWITPADMKYISGKYISKGNRNITENGLRSSSTRLLSKNSIVYSSRAPIGYIAITETELCTNQGFKSIDLYNKEIVDYLYYSLIYFTPEIQSRASGTTFKEISGTAFENTIIPLPPLNEQKRIVVKIEELLPYIEQYAEKEEKLTALHQQFPEQLKKSILQAAIQGKLTKQAPNDEPALVLIERIKAEKLRLIAEKKLKKPKVVSEIVLRDNLPYEIINGEERCIADEVPFEIPENWCWVRLGNLVELISGQDLAPEQYSKESIGIPYITGASNISNEKLEINRYTNQATKIAKKGDLLITCKGTIGEMIFLDLEKAHIARQIMAIRNHFFVNKYYIFFYLQSYINTLKNAAKSMIPGISRNDLLDILFPLPPFNEQKRIVEKIEKLFSALQNLERN
ncbi:restriction endonuclease subunit S [Actinobacillus pleuropneumoniae]|uniref:restriction endonuclease subunit S n=2 Tax=Actinobacillus pleuropneumoniae TaxID=715 RepID=UPI002277EF0E|nr:restriction endonuclease subunit S [Actinobacillus pleuropneumoniae]MCY6395977.1 restriction endonuclease subunit S [Actinobacillus pleuropneumoniae]MCY6409777.1 restriction endonuclease subunit S [Actinobacillus pleuropneumoniae]